MYYLQHMDINSELKSVHEEIERLEIERALIDARISGLRAQQAALGEVLDRLEPDPDPMDLHPGDSPSNYMVLLTRSAAIAELLRKSGRDMSVTQIWRGLQESGREEPDYQVVASTLSQMYKQGDLRRPSRGRYALAEVAYGRRISAELDKLLKR